MRLTIFLFAILFSAESVWSQPAIEVGSGASRTGVPATITLDYVSHSSVNSFQVDIAFDSRVINVDLTQCGGNLGGRQVTCQEIFRQFFDNFVRVTGPLGTGAYPSGSLGSFDVVITPEQGATPGDFPLTIDDETYESCTVQRKREQKGFGCVEVPAMGSVAGNFRLLAEPAISAQPASGETLTLSSCPGQLAQATVNFSETVGDSDGQVDCALASATAFELVPASFSVPAGGSADLLVRTSVPTSTASLSDELTCTLDGSPAPYTLTIAYETAFAPATVNISAVDTVKAEGDSGASPVIFQVQLDAATGCPFELPYSVVALDTAADDLDAAGGLVSFAGSAGETLQIFVDIFGDVVTELDEDFEVAVASGDLPLTIAGTPATGTIINDDQAMVQLNNVATIAVFEDSTDEDDQLVNGEAELAVVLDGTVDVPLTVDYQTRDGTATAAGGDYAPATGTLMLAGMDGESQTARIEILANQIFQPSRDFFVDFSALNAQGRDVQLRQPPTSEIRILDNDPNPGACADGFRAAGGAPVRISTVPNTSDLIVAYATALDRIDRATFEQTATAIRALSGTAVESTVIQRDSGSFRSLTTTENGYVEALDMHTSDVLWSRLASLPGSCPASFLTQPQYFSRRFSAPINAAFGEDVIVVGTASTCSAENQVLGLDADTGVSHWVFNSTGTSFDLDSVHGMVADEQNAVVYVTTDRRQSTSQSSVLAIDVTTGALLWDRSAGQILTPPVLYGGRLYVLSLFGELTTLDALTGDILWSLDLDPAGATPTPLPMIMARRGSQAGALYVLDVAGTVYRVDDEGDQGTIGWSRVLTDFEGGASTRLAVDGAGGRLFVSGFGTTVQVLDVRDGRTLTPLEFETTGEPIGDLLLLRIPGQQQDALFAAEMGVHRRCLGVPVVMPEIESGTTVNIGVNPGTVTVFEVGFSGTVVKGAAADTPSGLVTCTISGDGAFQLVNESATVIPGETASIGVQVTAPPSGDTLSATLNCKLDDGSPYLLSLETGLPSLIFADGFEP